MSREQVARLFWPEPFECDTMPAGKKMALDAADRILTEIIAPLTAERDKLHTELAEIERDNENCARAFEQAMEAKAAAQALLAEAREVLTKLADAAELDMHNNQKDDEDHPGGGWWSLRTDEAIREARSLLARLTTKEPPTPAPPDARRGR